MLSCVRLKIHFFLLLFRESMLIMMVAGIFPFDINSLFHWIVFFYSNVLFTQCINMSKNTHARFLFGYVVSKYLYRNGLFFDVFLFYFFFFHVINGLYTFIEKKIIQTKCDAMRIKKIGGKVVFTSKSIYFE